MRQDHIRNFCIIAHIDHGKSTLSDRLIEYTNAVPKRQMQEQILDSMDLERERGITIKLNSVQLVYQLENDPDPYYFNLIDTPGHVDFTYEVSRSLAACEGAALVVDATQGIQAQTVANVYLAIDAGLTIIPVINKIDLPSADVNYVADELEDQLGIRSQDILQISAKSGLNIAQLISAIIERIPPPNGNRDAKLSVLIFDSLYDEYKGVVCYVRVVDGTMRVGDEILLMTSEKHYRVLELGVKTPLKHVKKDSLSAGEVGYIIIGVQGIRDVIVGDTITEANNPIFQPLPGCKKIKPMVYAGIFLMDSSQFQLLKDSMAKIALTDSALSYEVVNSHALGFGILCGFLGLLHVDIICERLRREYRLDLLVTSPSVAYELTLTNKEVVLIDNLAKFPDRSKIKQIAEPFVRVTIFCRDDDIGNVMTVCDNFRGKFISMNVDHEKSKKLIYEMPMAEMICSFFDQLKSATKGYVSYDYEYIGMVSGNLVKVDILLNKEKVDAFSFIAHSKDVYTRSRKICEKLKEIIPRHLFEISIQAAVGSKVIFREDIKAIRKNVTAKCYGGDVSRKKKLLEKQKEGKKRMKQFSKISLPQDIFIEVFKQK